MKDVSVALVGFGNVGRAFATLIEQKKERLLTEHDLNITITGIATRSRGMAINPAGIDPLAAVNRVTSGDSLDTLSTVKVPGSIEEFIQSCPADVLMENIPVNYLTGKPGVDYMRLALKRGMHGITANKTTLVHGYTEFKQLEKETSCQFRYESTVLDGTPVFSLFRDLLPLIEINSISGILNATSNYVLGKMEEGCSYEDAVKQTQEMGIAETDPSGDLEGWDAAVKLAALVTVIYDYPITPMQVKRQGITHVTPQMIDDARQRGERWKMVCEAHRSDGGVSASVALQCVPPSSLLYTINEGTTYLQFETDTLPVLGITEAGEASADTTAYGLLTDLIEIMKGS